MLPDDDRDRLLARRIGERLDQYATPLDPHAEDGAPDEAPFYRALSAFKQAHDEPVPADAAARSWAALDRQVAQPAQPGPALRLIRSLTTAPAARWAMAASVLALVAVGWLLWGRTTAPVLLAAADDAIVTYTLDDGSVVRLRPHSQLYALDAEAAHYRLDGEGFFDVTKNEARTFTVEAGHARIEVLGTRFNVSTWGTHTAVYLEEGRVRLVHTPSQHTVALSPGQASRVMPEGRLAEPAPADSSEHLDWLRQEMNFARRPVHVLLDELAQHYAISFELPDAVRDETVSGRVLLDRLDQSLGDLGVILSGRFVPIDANTYRFVPD